MNEMFIWLGIALCISQSATLSGLNLAVFSLSRLRLETAAKGGDADAQRVLALRRDSNYTLVTILWANVAVNVLLTLLAESILAGVAAFLFSTVVITFIGEILPQAFFTRYALRVASLLSPLLRFYQILLWPLARPVGKLLDIWVGPEPIPWYQESELRDVLAHHAREGTTEVGKIEATGAINFLALDDLPVQHEGEPLDPDSVFELPFEGARPVFPAFERQPDDPFLKRLAASEKKWAVITDADKRPRCVVNTHAFLREAMFGGDSFRPEAFCHRPLVVDDPARPIGRVLGRLHVSPEKTGDDVIDKDIILVWTDTQRRIITGSDILGRLLRKIVQNVHIPATGSTAQAEPPDGTHDGDGQR